MNQTSNIMIFRKLILSFVLSLHQNFLKSIRVKVCSIRNISIIFSSIKCFLERNKLLDKLELPISINLNFKPRIKLLLLPQNSRIFIIDHIHEQIEDYNNLKKDKIL